jgi:hypothetical protein
MAKVSHGHTPAKAGDAEVLHALGVEPVNKIGGVADFEGIKANIHCPFRGCETRKRRMSMHARRHFWDYDMDLGDIRLERSPAASGGLLGGGQAGVRKPRRLKITLKITSQT